MSQVGSRILAIHLVNHANYAYKKHLHGRRRGSNMSRFALRRSNETTSVKVCTDKAFAQPRRHVGAKPLSGTNQSTEQRHEWTSKEEFQSQTVSATGISEK